MLQSQLTAGCGYFLSPRNSRQAANSRAEDDFFESLKSCFAGRCEGASLEGIMGDQIDAGVDAFEGLYEAAGVVLRVIDAFEQYHLDEDVPAWIFDCVGTKLFQ